jgi:hypothetical protein
MTYIKVELRRCLEGMNPLPYLHLNSSLKFNFLFSTLKMKAIFSYETPLNLYQISFLHILEHNRFKILIYLRIVNKIKVNYRPWV